jgi:hypothetical protein
MKYHYKGFWNCDCVCGVEIDQENKIVVFIELEENTGTSITNIIEILYCQFSERLETDWDSLTVFEVYDYEFKDKFSVSLVTLDVIPPGRIVPKWKFFERSEFLDFLKNVNSPLLEKFL